MKAGPHRWILLPSRPPLERPLAEALGVSPWLARILVQRGCDTTERAVAFLRPRLQNLSDPFSLPNVRLVAERLQQAVARQERIVIYGDYDVDGITSTALLVRLLRLCRADVCWFLPLRMEEGYGLSADATARCLAEHRPRLLVAVDCGTTAVDEIAALKRQGVETLVLDHHQPAAVLPDCPIVNPKLGADPSLANLATAGVVFKVCHGLLKLARPAAEAPAAAALLRQHLDLVAVGTVADVVPLDGENRILVRAGLEQLARTSNPGLQALQRVAGVPDKPSPHHISFQLGPRLNALGRLGDALAALELLLTDRTDRANDLADLLDRRNRDRQQIEQQTVAEAMEMLADFDPAQRVIVLARQGWHSGVVGIVAARIMREFHRPTVIISLDADGNGKGSARSLEGFPLVAALRRCEDLLERYGGHRAAAGLSLRAAHVPALRQRLNAVAAEMLSAEDLVPTVEAVAELPLSELTPALMEELQQLEPFGMGNPQPVFIARGVPLRARPKTVGQGHLKLWLGEGQTAFDAIGFGMGDRVPDCERVDIAFTPQWNEFQGQRAIQIRLVDWRNNAS